MMSILRTAIFVCLAGLSTSVDGQQLASWSQFRTYQYAFNPAVIDVFELAVDGNPFDVDIAYRAQWTGFDDGPRTAMVGMQYANIYQNMSFGGFLLNDAFGPTDYTQLQLQYAYQLNFDRGEEHFLSLGLSGSLSHYRIQNSALSLESPGDPLIGDADQSTLSPNIGIGIYYLRKLDGYAEDVYLFGGISAEQLLPADVRFTASGTSGANLQREMHLHAFGGARYYYDGRGYDYIEPVAWVRYVRNAPVHFDVGVKMTFAEERFWFGAALGSAFQLQWQAGVGISEQWSIGYANSMFLTQQLSQPTGFLHEVSVSYRGLL